MSQLELDNLTIETKLNSGEATFDVVEVEMFLQEMIAQAGEKEKLVTSFEIVPLFQEWSSNKGYVLTPSEAWQIMKVCRQRFDDAKKKLESSST